jgi:hypothetical protein
MAQSKSKKDAGAALVPDVESSADVVAALNTEPISSPADEPSVEASSTDAKQPKPGDLKADDQEHAVHGDAEPHDPPVRTNRPDVPVIQRLAVGAGEHKPLNDPDFGPDGRLLPEVLDKIAEEQS